MWESNPPTRGQAGPAGFEDRWDHQAPSTPLRPPKRGCKFGKPASVLKSGRGSYVGRPSAPHSPCTPILVSRPPPLPRNPGAALDLDWIARATLEPDEIDAVVARVTSQNEPRGEARIDRLSSIVTCIDLTSLAGDDTPSRILELCRRARSPLTDDLVVALGRPEPPPAVAAVCVHHAFVPTAVGALAGSGVEVAAVSAGFPHGLSPLETRVAEIHASLAAGAAEIDLVIQRTHVLMGAWHELYDELRAFRLACGAATMKTILATGELASPLAIYRTSLVAMMAGTDFIKTSTGKERVNATLPAGVAMLRAIRDYESDRDTRIGFKPAGGIRTAADALQWMALVDAEVGPGRTTPGLFRIGATSLLDDVVDDLTDSVSDLQGKRGS